MERGRAATARKERGRRDDSSVVNGNERGEAIA
jgi:hypothetical protein